MLKIYIGFDSRQPISYTVLQNSIFRHASVPVSITPLCLETMPCQRQGLTPFTFSRFLVPYLCDYQGWALFLDIDMLLCADVNELFKLKDDAYAVMVSKNPMRFEWPSMMLYNCAKCTVLTPEYVAEAAKLHLLDWVKEEEIGELPREWNHLVGYDPLNPNPKLIHYTQGVPAYPETKDCEHADKWKKEFEIANSTQPWVTLMGNSVHAKELNGKMVPKLTPENT